MTKSRLSLCLLAAVSLAGCATSPIEPIVGLTPDQKEALILSSVTQLSLPKEFERAGEAYFSKDMKWIVFQAIPKAQPWETPETAYQIYVARLVYVQGEPSGLVVTTRLTPKDSRNTCGWFSDDGKTLLFASTAGKNDPDEAAPGYQRQGRNYRWAFSKGMEIYAIHDWEKKVAASSEGFVNLALPENRITNNDNYDAECSFSPDGKHIVFCSDRPSSLLSLVKHQDIGSEVLSNPTTQPSDPKEKKSDVPTNTTTSISLSYSHATTTVTPTTTQPASNPKQLYVMNADGTNVVQLTSTAGYNGGAFFSPDGRKLVYRSDRVGNDLLQVLISDVVYDWKGNITGLKNERALTDDVNVNWAPYFSPDGERVVFASSKIAHTNYEIFSVRAKGNISKPETLKTTRLTYSGGPDVLPVVSPDGKYLMWSARRGNDRNAQIYIAKLTWPKGS